MPGNPLAASSSRTEGNISPRSSATMGRSPSALRSARNSSMRGPTSHRPLRAVVSPKGMAQ